MTGRALLGIFWFLSTSACGDGVITSGPTAGDRRDTGDDADDGSDDDTSDSADPTAARIDATLDYDGVRRFDGADVYLLTASEDDDACDAIDPQAPSGAIDVVTLTDALRDTAHFAGLREGERLVVAAAALDETGVVSAFGCSEALDVSAGVLDVRVPVVELPASLSGTWDLESELHVTEGLPFGTRLALGLLDEMTDDANDPATFLLDLLLAQFIEDESLRTALSWVRQSAGIDRGLNDRIRVSAGDLLFDLLDGGGDLARAIDELKLDSRLEIGARNEHGTWLAQHQLLDLVFEVDGRQARFSIADDVELRDTTAGNVVVALDDDGRFEVGRHSFAVGLGTLALFALHEVVLPRLDGSPRTLGEMLTMLVDCRDVGDWLSEEVGVGSRYDWEDACELGLAGIGSYLELQILALDGDVSTLELGGHAETAGGKLVPSELRGGEWEATWGGAAGEMPFGGSFVGRRDPRSWEMQ